MMKSRGWTMERLASCMTDKTGKVGVSQGTVSQIINGNPTVGKLEEIARILDCDVSDFFNDSDASEVFTCPKCGQKFRMVPVEGEQDKK